MIAENKDFMTMNRETWPNIPYMLEKKSDNLERQKFKRRRLLQRGIRFLRATGTCELEMKIIRNMLER